MNWSKDWLAGTPPMWPEPKEGEIVVIGIVPKEATAVIDIDQPSIIGVDLASGPDICIVEFETDEGKFSGQLIGDLIVYSDWGWKVAHYPTGASFHSAVPQVEYGKPPYTKESLLRWCDTVQTKHGSLWAILRELTPDNYDDKTARVLQAKDRIRDWCLSVEVE